MADHRRVLAELACDIDDALKDPERQPQHIAEDAALQVRGVVVEMMTNPNPRQYTGDLPDGIRSVDDLVTQLREQAAAATRSPLTCTDCDATTEYCAHCGAKLGAAVTPTRRASQRP
jgi:hypothetical protein